MGADREAKYRPAGLGGETLRKRYGCRSGVPRMDVPFAMRYARNRRDSLDANAEHRFKMSQPVKKLTLTVDELFVMCRKLKDRHLGENILAARSGDIELVITDVVSVPHKGLLVFEVAQEKPEPMILIGPINGAVRFPPEEEA